MTIEFEDCRRELLDRSNRAGVHAYQHWLNRPGFEDVHSFVHGFTHKHLFEVTVQELNSVKKRSSHALGDVQTAEQLPEVENFTCPFALQHLFHRCIRPLV